MTVEVENYQITKDFKLTISYNQLGFFEIRIIPLTQITTTLLKVKLIDPEKIVA